MSRVGQHGLQVTPERSHPGTRQCGGRLSSEPPRFPSHWAALPAERAWAEGRALELQSECGLGKCPDFFGLWFHHLKNGENKMQPHGGDVRME